ncbi:hypothetical protein [Pseudomonas sichuanensis]|uniref:Uncharacterized protein n=1 Tax=Pseudomonas sichuanensis TaxID=2213015 RepID=A0ABV0DDI7_9PSED
MPYSDQRYRAYQLLRELDASTSIVMNEVAYGRIGGPCWGEAVLQQQKAFKDWIDYAETLVMPEIQPCSLVQSEDQGLQDQV